MTIDVGGDVPAAVHFDHRHGALVASAQVGFRIGNVHVMAGVPSIFQAMLDNVVPTLKAGTKMLSATVHCPFGEGLIGGPLAGTLIAISFAVVASLYIVLAEATQVALDRADHRVITSPVATVAEVVFGETGRLVVSVIGALIVVISVVLALSFRFTRFGLATRAVAESERGALVTGLSPERIAVTNAAISAMVAAANQIPQTPGIYHYDEMKRLADSLSAPPPVA